MFYLIGVNHDAQRHSPGARLNEDQRKLERCLCEAIDRYKPALIVVEESLDSLKNPTCGGVSDDSIPCEIASRYGIESLLCEPHNAQKTVLRCRDEAFINSEIRKVDFWGEIPETSRDFVVTAISMALFFPLREEFWIEKLGRHLRSEVILVCGENHVESFGRRPETVGVEVKVVSGAIGVASMDILNSQAARRYPFENPKMFCKLLQHFTAAAEIEET